MTVNAQSLKYKMEEFREVIDRGKEWMGDAIFSLKDYNYYRDDRDEKGGGETLLYISKNWDKGHVNH